MTNKQLQKRYKGYRRRKLPKWIVLSSYTLLVLICVLIVVSSILIATSMEVPKSIDKTDTTEPKRLVITSKNSAETFKSNEDVQVSTEDDESEVYYEGIQGYGYPMIDISTEDMITVAGAVSVLGESEPYECKVAIAQVLYNRMKYYGEDISHIIEEPRQFRDYELYYDGPDCDVCYGAAIEALYNPPLPISVFFFQKDEYHHWEGIHDYKQIGNYYFSWSQKVYDDYNAAGYTEESPGKK